MKTEEVKEGIGPNETNGSTDSTSKKEEAKPKAKKKGSDTVQSIRADNNTFEDFKKLIEKYELKNQNQALGELVKTYELLKAQSVLIDRKSEIESFNSHVSRINELYLHSLELCEEADTKAKLEVESLLKSKDMTIQDLQQSNMQKEAERKEALDDKSYAESQLLIKNELVERLEIELQSLKQDKSTKDEIIKGLTKLHPKTEQQEAEIEGLKCEIEQLQAEKRALEEAKQEIANSLSKAGLEYIEKARKDLQELEASRKEVQNLTQQVNTLMFYYNEYIKEHPDQSMQQQVQ